MQTEGGLKHKIFILAFSRTEVLRTMFTLGILALPTQAAVVTFPDLTSFLTATGPVAFESFEQTPLLAYGQHLSTDIGPFTIAIEQAFGTAIGIFTTGPTNGQHPTDGSRYVAYNARTFRLTFEQPITALSLDFIDFGDVPLSQGQELTMTTPAGDSVFIKKTVVDGDPANGNEFFFGFTSDIPLTEVTFHTTIGDNMAVDAVRYASVPEPSATLLGMCGAGWLFARKRTLGLRR